MRELTRRRFLAVPPVVAANQVSDPCETVPDRDQVAIVVRGDTARALLDHLKSGRPLVAPYGRRALAAVVRALHSRAGD
jgi:hypothetical protein